ncbi:MAG: hypothetical protein Q4Q06_07380, partial [Bacteroidota bacterium]|nr:hypothetical protein [Bacteroidota bacterium]
LVIVNTNNKTFKYLLSFTYETPFGDIYFKEHMPLFGNGILFKQEEKLSQDEEDIIYSLDMYYSKLLDFGSK